MLGHGFEGGEEGDAGVEHEGELAEGEFGVEGTEWTEPREKRKVKSEKRGGRVCGGIEGEEEVAFGAEGGGGVGGGGGGAPEGEAAAVGGEDCGEEVRHGRGASEK